MSYKYKIALAGGRGLREVVGISVIERYRHRPARHRTRLRSRSQIEEPHEVTGMLDMFQVPGEIIWRNGRLARIKGYIYDAMIHQDDRRWPEPPSHPPQSSVNPADSSHLLFSGAI